MKLLPIVMHPDPVLRQVCSAVEVFDEALARLSGDMLHTMYAAEGRGLAAPQVGDLRRIFVFDADWKAAERNPFVCVNPVVTPLGPESRTVAEQCLSIPDTPVEVTRPARIRLDWQDVTGAHHQQEFTGDAAVVIQHEADHLEGRLVLDYQKETP
ncbi:MAG: peptide deformylase [Rhodobacteraceae bacterium]|nr:peptide deformylase [Paracoccaceae bacterium]